MRYDTSHKTLAMTPQQDTSSATSSSFRKDDEEKKPSRTVQSLPLDEELQINDVVVFENSQSSSVSNVTEHSSSSVAPPSQDRVRQFNALLGLSLSRSIAEFYLEVCAQDVEQAVAFFKEQLKEPAPQAAASRQQLEQPLQVQPQHQEPLYVKPYAQAPAPAVASAPRRRQPGPPLRRLNSHDPSTLPLRPRVHLPRRNKSFDATEAASVTAPALQRSNHAPYKQQQQHTEPSQSLRPAAIPRRCSVAVTPRKVPFRGNRARPAMPLVRSKSERRVRDAPALQGNTSLLTSSTVHRLPPRSRSNDSHVLHKQQSLRGGDYYQNNVASVTRPPTARSFRSPYQRSMSARQLHHQEGYGWEPPTQTAGASNPAA